MTVLQIAIGINVLIIVVLGGLVLFGSPDPKSQKDFSTILDIFIGFLLVIEDVLLIRIFA